MSLVRVPLAASVATPMAGPMNETNMLRSAADENVVLEKNHAATISANGPDRLKLICSRATSNSSAEMVSAMDGTRSAK